MDAGAMPYRIALENPVTTVPDGDGQFTQTWAPLSPSPVWFGFEDAAPQPLERLVADTIAPKATDVIRIRFHPQVTTETRGTWNGHVFQVRGVQNTRRKNVELLLTVEEVVP